MSQRYQMTINESIPPSPGLLTVTVLASGFSSLVPATFILQQYSYQLYHHFLFQLSSFYPPTFQPSLLSHLFHFINVFDIIHHYSDVYNIDHGIIINSQRSIMKSLLRFIGRLLFVTLLLSSAVLKIKQPTVFTTEVTNGYTTIRSLHPSLGDVLPTVNSVNAHVPFATLVRAIGATEGLIALLIVFGDSLGGVLFFVYLTVYGLANYAPNIVNIVAKQNFSELMTLLPNLSLFVTLLGFSFIFMAGRNVRKAAFKA